MLCIQYDPQADEEINTNHNGMLHWATIGQQWANDISTG